MKQFIGLRRSYSPSALALAGLSSVVLAGLILALILALLQPDMGMDWQTRTGMITTVHADGAAAAAGLQVGEQIVAIDGVALAALPNASNGRRAGKTVTVTVAGEQPRQVALFLKEAPPVTQLERLIPLILGLGFLVVGLLAFGLAADRSAATLFALICLAVASVLATGLLSSFKIGAAARLFNVALLLAVCLNITFHAHFPHRHAGPAMRRAQQILYAILALVATLIILAPWELLRWHAWYDLLQWLVRFLLVFSLLTQIILLVYAGRAGDARAARHARLLVAGAVIALLPFLLLSLLPELLVGYAWWPYPYTFPFLLIMPLVYSYTLLRDRFSDWDGSVARLATFFIVAIFLLSGCGLVLQPLDRSALSWQPAVLALMAGLALWPLVHLAERWVERVLFGARYDFAQLVSELGEQMASILDRASLRRLLVERLPEMMPFAGAALLLAEEEGELRLEPPATLATGALSGLPADGLLAHLLSANKDVIDGKILPALIQGELRPSEAAWLGGEQAAYWLPLVVDGRLWGVLLLGPYASGRPLSGEDRRVLRHVAHQAALAAANIYLADTLRASRAELARAHSELLLVREEERQQMAWALHDGPIQNLLAIGHRLAMLARQLPHKAEEVAQLRQDIIGEVNLLREMYSQLRPGVLDELGLFQALRALAYEYERNHELLILFEPESDVDDLPDTAATTLFRVAQEGLTNVVRHSGANCVRIVLSSDHLGVSLSLEDDGRGFLVPERLTRLARAGHFGLIGLAERLERLGGRLELSGEPGSGTTLRAWLPYKAPRR
jgi:signal transduction histidine kinase